MSIETEIGDEGQSKGKIIEKETVGVLSMAIEKRELKALLKELGAIKGRHTELVSVYAPAGYNMAEIGSLIKQEQSTASNIKSKTTRKAVLSALEKISGRIKFHPQAPPHGLVLFCGNISPTEAVVDIKLWEFEPPEPIVARIYRCDQTFVLEPLGDMVREKEVYGLIVLDTHDAAIGFLKGKTISVAKKLKSIVPGKQIKGGQSAARFQRVREGLLLNWKKEVGEIAKATFEQERDLRGIIIGGPGIIKDEFASGPFLPEALKKKILGMKDLGYSGEEGMKELIERAQDILKEASVFKEKQLLQKFFEHLKRDTHLVAYKKEQVKDALEKAAVEILIISEQLKDRALADELSALAEQTGAKVVEVSQETPEGQQFLQLSGVGAILRFRIE